MILPIALWVGWGWPTPLGASVPAAVAQCISAGIRLIMINGDDLATALAIAKDEGIGGDAVIDGTAWAELSDKDLAMALQTAVVFARIQPEPKLRIVKALQTGSSIVAVTGVGVNDAPSLKAAEIGVAMSGRGTDVAREVPDAGPVIDAIADSHGWMSRVMLGQIGTSEHLAFNSNHSLRP